MAKIYRLTRATNGDLRAQYSVQVNIVLKNSKKMTEAEQDSLMANEPNSVRILIADADNPEKILLDELVEPRVFSTGSVGYSARSAKASFLEQ